MTYLFIFVYGQKSEKIYNKIYIEERGLSPEVPFTAVISTSNMFGSFTGFRLSRESFGGPRSLMT